VDLVEVAPALAGILLVAAAAAFALLPLLRTGDREPSAVSVTAVGQATQARLALYRQVLDLEFDHQTGKLSAKDLEHLSAELLARAAQLMPTGALDDEALDFEIEQEIALARREIEHLSLVVPKEPLAS
jgi:hypothetical protein